MKIRNLTGYGCEYLNAVIDDDVYRIDGIKRNTQKMKLLLRSLARNESTTVTNKTLKNDIKEIDDEDIDVDTVSEYLDIFARFFITDNQPPFSTGVRSSARVKQAVKRHFSDPSLACALLRITPESLLRIKRAFEDDPKGKPPEVLCVVCGLSNAAYRREDGVYVVPVTALKN